MKQPDVALFLLFLSKKLKNKIDGFSWNYSENWIFRIYSPEFLVIEGYKSYSAGLSNGSQQSSGRLARDPFVKGSSTQQGVHLYKICWFSAVLKWVLCIKFSRAIFAWKKVKCNIYATLQKMISSNPLGFEGVIFLIGLATSLSTCKLGGTVLY